MASSSFRAAVMTAAALAVVVVLLGAFTRLVDAGLGCPDWPGCYGVIGVPQTAEELSRAAELFPDAPFEADKAWPEVVHHGFAGALMLVVLGLVIWSFRGREDGLPFGLCVGLLILISCQAAFGAWTVTLKLWPQVVTAHLLGGFASLSMLWLIALRSGTLPGLTPRPDVAGIATVALVFVILQVTLGGWVTSNYAALACHDFPTCHGLWVPEMDLAAGFNIFQSVGPNYLGGVLDSDARTAIQIGHRVGALLVFVTCAWLAWRLIAGQSALGWVLAGVLAIQILLGILNVLMELPLAVATAHNGFGAVLLLVVITANFVGRASLRTGIPTIPTGAR